MNTLPGNKDCDPYATEQKNFIAHWPISYRFNLNYSIVSLQKEQKN